MSRGDKSTHNRKLKIRQLINDVRRKYLAFKLGRSEADESINRIISPITKRSDKMTQHMKHETSLATKPPQPKSSTPIGIVTKALPDVEGIEEKPSLSKTMKKELDPNALSDVKKFENNNHDDDDENVGTDSKKISKEMHNFNSLEEETLETYPKNVQRFIRQSLNRDAQIDFTYGPKYDPRASSWSLGGCSLDFDSGKIIIDGEFYFPDSEGLLKLLFNKEPVGFTREDEENYQRILNITNVHRREFNPSKQIKANIGHKYKNIIKKLGGGMMMRYNEKAIEYRYWNDINELVDRLCLLHASKEAGNNSNDNEIEAIVDELREAGIIY